MDLGFEGQDIRTMVIFGQGEYATPWVEESSPSEVTRFVLFPAAKYGQVSTLKRFIDKGECRDLSGKPCIHLSEFFFQPILQLSTCLLTQ